MLRGRKSTPKNIPSGIDALGLFRKARNSTGKGGVSIRSKGGKKK